jgi:hypothetical protein
MGSGAFLVEACRALAAKLVAAWSRYQEKKPIIPPDEDEELHARRLVAQRCLYGVDKNPLATDLARLSLWLATLARDHEFTFLDHALKSGDSLVGLTQAQIAAAHWDTSKPGLPLFRQLVKDRVAEVMKGRDEIQAAADDTARAIQEARHTSLEARLRDIRLIGDAVIAAFFAEDKPNGREKKRAEVESWMSGSTTVAWDKLAATATKLHQAPHPLPPFHWEIEFPEVFAREQGGFDAIVGNPPFLGGKSISTNFGNCYSYWLEQIHPGGTRSADIVAHFIRRAFGLLSQVGSFGLVATKTIRQGDTRETGLAPILAAGGHIRRVLRRLKWPGEASVMVSIIHVSRKMMTTKPSLDGRSVRRISAYLVEGDMDTTPSGLAENWRKAFVGSYILGMGFTFDENAAASGESESLQAMSDLIKKDPRNNERIFPYLGGEEVNNDPRHSHHRFVIDFFDRPLSRDASLSPWQLMSEEERAACRSRGIVPRDYSGECAEDWPDLLNIVRERVKPGRDKQKRAALRLRWWQFADKRPGLYRSIEHLRNVIVTPRVSPHCAFTLLPSGSVFSDQLIIIATSRMSAFCILHCAAHETWARFFASSLGDTLRYTPSDCFEPFPFPPAFEMSSVLEAAGQAYYDCRAKIMVARNEGMTKTYNRFHDRSETVQDIQCLRELHAAMDRAVLGAYGWRDLAARAEPIFLDETNEDEHPFHERLFWPSDFRDEVLARLLALNAERHTEEVRVGIAPGMNGKERDEEGEKKFEAEASVSA